MKPSCKTKANMKSLAYLFIPLFCLLSCVNESRTGEVLILTRLDGAAKSRLIHDENGLEKVNEVCCFAYDSRNGLLETTVYQRGNSFSLSLDKNAGHRLYVLANLGDQCSMAPVRMDGMSDYSCPVPAIREMSRGGLPMCGAIDLERGSDGSEIRLRRLMARLVVNIRTDSEFGGSGAVNAQDIKVLQCPNVFYPFSVGGSSARRAEEVSLTAWDSESLLFSGADNIELFVPENCQGDLLGSGVSQMEKSLSNPELDAVKGALCTYIEVEADKNNSGDGVSGNLTYRFFPGNGSAKNFDLAGGYAYYIDLILSWNGMFVEGNWKVSRENWTDERSLLVSGEADGPYSAKLNLELPPGTIGQKHYLRFSPLSDGTHSAEGWTMSKEGEGLEAEILSNGSSYACIGVSLDENLSIGSTKSILYKTKEGRHLAKVNIVLSPAYFGLDRYEQICSDSDVSAFSVRIISSNFPVEQISVSSSSPELILLSHDRPGGIVRARWASANSGNTRRSASLIFSGLGRSVSCRVHQLSPSSFSIDDEEDAGEGEQTF